MYIKDEEKGLQVEKKTKTQVKIKICGLRTPADVAAVNAVLPEFCGFIFVPMRRRYVAPAQAAILRQQLDPRIRPVGVFVDAQVEDILDVLEQCPLDMVQLHGSEDDDYIAMLRSAYRKRWRGETGRTFMNGVDESPGGVEKQGCFSDEMHSIPERPHDLCIVKAFRIEDEEDIRRAEASIADEILLDHGAGGTGECFDWSLLPHCRRRFFLAGGLGPDNVEEAITRTQPYAVDVSSSLETDGRKDPEKIRRFVEAVRGTIR